MRAPVNSNSAMNKLLLAGLILLASLAAACGGGSSSTSGTGGGGSGTVPQGATYSTSSVSGTYAFQMSGSDGSGLPISRIGSFVADGQGNITAAIEDVNDGGSSSTFVFTAAPSSNYTVGTDGKGELTLVHPDATVAGAVDTFTFTIALNSTSGGLMVETDGSSTMSGNFQLQAVSTTFAGSYAFDFTGVDLGSSNSASFIGEFTTNSTSAITGGQMDVNDGASPSGVLTISPGTITQDPTNFSTFGRGTLNLSTSINSQLLNLTYVFYVVDNSHLIFVENDSIAETSGSAIAQTNVPTTLAAFPDSFVFAVGGGAFGSGTFGSLAGVGRFTASASGAISNLSLDEDFSGGVYTFPFSGGFSNVTYTIDAGGSGRGTLNFTDVTRNQPFVFVFYMASPTQGFMQDDSGNVVADGSIQAQSGTFSASSMAGTYAVNWSGTNLSTGFEEDFVGVLPISNAATNNISNGVVDFTELGVGKIYTGIPVSGLFTIQGDGTLGGASGNALQLTTGGNVPSTTFNFRAYLVNQNTIILMGVDSNRVVIGTALRQQ